jgi:hypothetical protein
MGPLRAHKAKYLEEWKIGSEYLPFFRSSILPFLALTAQKMLSQDSPDGPTAA